MRWGRCTGWYTSKPCANNSRPGHGPPCTTPAHFHRRRAGSDRGSAQLGATSVASPQAASTACLGFLRVTLNDGITDASFLVDVLLRQGLRLKMFKEEEINLEDVFMRITKGITN